ncbi:hypothetical protein F2Q69_00048015 [Brassica cretica]|uniref:Uncharacterized protein n=1 Tax=Brassica cretica TaxID=69181 RepID=A0A8S9PPN9_BRACR|nr:hypothetical protein F2Q69_00048015 [Brassica cretica]
MEPDQDGDQAVQISSTKVRPSDRTDQTDRAMYRIDPRTSGTELRMELRPDDGLIDPHAPFPDLLDMLRLIGEPDFTWDVKNPKTTKLLTSGPFGSYRTSRRTILKLSEDLTRARMQLVHEGHPAGCTDHPACALLLTAMDQINPDEPGQ